MTNGSFTLAPRWQFIAALVVFVVGFTYFLFLQAEPVFPDPDSFYHVKVAERISRQGVLETFPWLPYTNLSSFYTDQHFLYHVLLIPFTSFFAPLMGAKVATAIINAALMALMAVFLIRFHVRFWWFFLFVLFVTNPFLFRLNLVKAPGLSILLLVLGLWMLFRWRVWPLAILGFVYVWTYGGFSLLGIFAGVFVVVTALTEWHRRHMLFSFFRRRVSGRFRFGRIWRHRLMRILLAVFGGLAVGVLVNPYFPKNLFFYWQQLVQIGIVNFQDVVNVGGEWHPYGFVELIANTVFVSIVVLLAIVFFVIHRRRQTPESWTLLILTAFFLFITLKSRRYVELYVPFAVLFGAVSLRDAFPSLTASDLFRRLVHFLERRLVLAMLLIVYVLSTSLAVIARDTRQLVHDLRSGFRADYLAGASAWLAKNTPEGSIVVHSDWDEFPMLFYHNSANRYIAGLDPTFMYQHDAVLYQRWADLTSGKHRSDAERIITQDLQSTVVLVAKDHEAFRRTMEGLQAFSVVYEDGDAVIYRLTLPGGPGSGGALPSAEENANTP